ncbi:MAG: four helix bundle protein [Verrucomicrobia bacterium]|nr:four helix bundle protein [Verrucomicrobiota bacterium]
MKPPADLRVRTKDFALRVVRLFPSLPRSGEAQVLGRQLLRSATSIGANYREAYRGRSKAEFVAKCGDALREAEETAYWLELLADAQIASPSELQPLRQECDELIAILVTILKRSKQS